MKTNTVKKLTVAERNVLASAKKIATAKPAPKAPAKPAAKPTARNAKPTPAPKVDDVIGEPVKSPKGFRVSAELILEVKAYFKKDPEATLKAAKADLKISRHTIRKILAS